MKTIAAAVVCALLTLGASAFPIEAQSAQAVASPRRGIVRGDAHAFVDEGGPFLARGASVFWALWAYQHDRERLGRNLAVLREWGFDYIRVLGVVGAPGNRPGPVCVSGVQGCDTWRDRRVDPYAVNYAEMVAGLTDWAYREYGLRVQWSIFGGTEFTPTVESRRALVEQFARLSEGREQAIFAFEVANESFKNGFAGTQGQDELRALAKTLKSGTRNLVALSSPEGSNCAGARALYGGSVADLMTLHVGRASPKDGEHWKVMREIWDMRSCTGVPTLVSSNEPIGPQSSVESLEDPLALAAMALMSYGSGIGAVVFHSGPGVRGGGEADVVLGRSTNFWELPTARNIARGLTTVTRLLPGDAANWSRHDGLAGGDERLFDVSDPRAVTGFYCFTSANEFACAAVGIQKRVVLTARRPMAAAIHQLLDGEAQPGRRVAAGGELIVEAAPAAVLVRGRLE